ncbi:hypothetical protein FQR65_LT00399 [Abscondita terminalis]|nr:hypothetical protein FQR65_LT00399 [Abscondita terminalis]
MCLVRFENLLKIMKIIIVLLCAFVALSTQDQASEDSMKKIFVECGKENNITAEQGKQIEKKNFPNEPNVKCFLKCGMVKMNLMNGDTNAIDYDKIINTDLPQTTTESRTKVVNACKNINNSNGCELAYDFTLCWIKNEN